MTRRWVVNASPLILLGKIDRSSLLVDLCDELVLPDAVVREVGTYPDGQRLLEGLRNDSRVDIRQSPEVSPMIEAWDLGPGETEVLALAELLAADRVVVDDLEARRCAKSFDLRVIGTLGVVLRAKRQGLVSTARPLVSELRQAGLWIADELVERALRHLGE